MIESMTEVRTSRSMHSFDDSGLQPEQLFRDGWVSVLEKRFGAQVVTMNEFDDEGFVFGQPDEIELDVMIKNGLWIFVEFELFIDKGRMYFFERRVRFYERYHHRHADRMIMISPLFDDSSRRVGEKLGIEMYPSSLDVPVQQTISR
ncbi:MAG: DUF3782 domain-containing protein [Candidatus Thiosymbion ectosymbiont of Robbea hypermnestra]|nr:DUF3782 domain-containing protein [Candidatus Thiosymbion ectosymbiont of Robbea hypermnestra]